MRPRLSILICTLYAVLGTLNAQDYARMGERTLMGTARYVGMGGAMTAIGGDPSAVRDNPAGLGLYHRFEMLLSFGTSFAGNNHLPSGYRTSANSLLFPQASLVFSHPTYQTGNHAVVAHNFMFSYQRLHSFNRVLEGLANNSTSLGYLFNGTGVDLGIPYCKDSKNVYNYLLLNERGYVDQYSFHWAMNFADQWYAGVGVHMQSYLLESEAKYLESFNNPVSDRTDYYNENITSLVLSGKGFNMSLGVLYRPLGWLRMGAGVQFPTFGSLNTSTRGRMNAQMDSLRTTYAPDLNFSDRSFHMPWHLSTSVAFQLTAYGMIAVQYDLTTGKNQQPWHSIRTGVEVIPVMGMYLNAGYVFETNGRSYASPAAVDPALDRQDAYSVFGHHAHYASGAIGYRGTYMIVQLAYQYHFQQPFLFAHEYNEPYDNVRFKNNRIILTIGWHLN